ncbi:MAG: cytochrome C [Planctomycetota bacterium]|nr:MAG: cytochrome C [Planctomycetota bacterium]
MSLGRCSSEVAERDVWSTHMSRLPRYRFSGSTRYCPLRKSQWIGEWPGPACSMAAGILIACCYLTAGCAQEEPEDATAEAVADREIYNSEQEALPLSSVAEAVAAMELAPGFTVELFAGEPDVQNPIAACTDAQGRVWVAENYTYAERALRFDMDLNDRVLVLEDRDGDGQCDRRKVFYSGAKVLTGIAVGRGGVWLMCPPQVLFVPDVDNDLRPDGPPQVVLDGFTVGRENYHNFANGLSWGPDNWLYGRCGASAAGEIGLPGSGPEERIPLRGGIWRYHPETRAVEVLNQGTTNPWGHDWNSVGELFFINTVNGHFWHSIPGAHYDRPHTVDANRHVYQLLDTHADHWHFDTGKGWTASRDGAANDFGGGHAHIGMLLYQERLWPLPHDRSILTINMHGRRINMDLLDRRGSGYVARHGPDFLLSRDVWFRALDLIPLPDGNALLIDWSDIGECHEATGVHRQSGRIYRIAYTAPGDGASSDHTTARGPRFDPAGPLPEVIDAALAGPEWHARRAREWLVAQRLAGAPAEAAIARSRSVLSNASAPTYQRLRGLWLAHALGGVAGDALRELLEDPAPEIRTWAIRLLIDQARIDRVDGRRPADEGQPVPPDLIDRLVRMAADEPDSAVRLTLASTLQRLPLAARADLAIALMQHDDGEDHNIPLMVWYGVLPLGDAAADRLLPLVRQCSWPTTVRLLSRRIAAASRQNPALLDALVQIAAERQPEARRTMVFGMGEALAGWLKAPRPASWEALVAATADDADPQLQQTIQTLNVLFGDGRAIEELKRIAGDDSQPLDVRRAALESLVQSGAPGLRDLCRRLLKTRFLNTTALEGLARYPDPQIAEWLLTNYRKFHPFDRPQVIAALATRAAWAKQLLQAVATGRIDASEIPAFVARQIAALEDPELDRLLAEVWGQVRATPADRAAKIAELKEFLTSGALDQADVEHGQQVFVKQCGACHRLFGIGGNIGPDLTGAQRSNLDYLLDNIVDPSAVVTKEFRATVLLLDDDRVLTGLVTSEDDSVITLATQERTYRIPKEMVVSRKQSNVSVMPEGLLQPLSREEIRDLFGYLQAGLAQ